MYGSNENNKHENRVGFLFHKSIMPQVKQFNNKNHGERSAIHTKAKEK